MKGFDREFSDAPDFCRKITHRIWEDRGIDRIREYYAEHIPVHTPSGDSSDADDVVRSTTETLYTFPDRQLLDEDVISSEDSSGVFYSSHRILSVMTHLGSSGWGEPTGAEVYVRGAADCVYIENQVTEEWLIRDNAALLTQTGSGAREVAFELAEQQPGRFPSPESLLVSWSGGPDSGPPMGLAQAYAKNLEEMLTEAKVRNLGELYDQAATLYGPGGRNYFGSNRIGRFYIGYIASFPKSSFRLNHWIERRIADHPVRIALRWSMETKHEGHGHFGKPSGAPIAILGVTNAEIWHDKVVREFHVIDELSVWRQIAAHELGQK